jgi:hypothetical protein
MTRTRTALSALATLTGAAALWTASTIGAQEGKRTHAMFTPATTKWGAGPASLPPGAQAAALEGIPRSPARLPFESNCLMGTGFRRIGTRRTST